MCSTISVEAFISKIKQVPSLSGETEDSVKQYRVNVHPSNIDELLDLIAAPGQTIVFVDTRDEARILFERLQGNRFVCKTLDADTQDQSQRDKIIKDFKDKRFQVLIETVQTVIAGDTLYRSAARFEELNISNELLKGLYVGMQFERPSKVQSITLPMILSPPYKSLVALAKNGSGKAACFVLGMLNRVDPKVVAPQAICICPTRELAIQNMEVLQKMGKFTGITSELLAATQESTPGCTRPPVTTQVVFGTPGTINELIRAKKLDTSCLKIFVIDEADVMLAESGLKNESIRMLTEIVKQGRDFQVLLFCATSNAEVKACISNIFTELEKEYNKYAEKELSLDSVKQYKVKVLDESTKIMVIKKVLDLAQKLGQAIIFVRTRQSAYDLHKALREDYPVTAIQGASNQEERDTIVKEFKDGFTIVLISNDLLARGFDQPQVNLLVNYDLPVIHNFPTEPDNDMYLHRIGRVGRFGRKGVVFNLLSGETDYMIMEKIERHSNHFVAEVPSWESDEGFEDALKKAL